MLPDNTQTTISRRGLRRAGWIGAVVVIVVVVSGVATRANDARDLRKWTDAQTEPTVSIVPAAPSENGSSLDLPGRLEAYSRAPIYARVSGYLKSWKVDIGTPVKAGQLLAEIETPDLDQQLLQAKADLATAQANATLAGTTAKRWQSMLASDSVSRQEVDEKTGDFAAKQAIVKAAQANVDRVEALKGFTRITSPFDGVVTARETDVGALINVGSAAGQELFVVSDMRKLRVYVRVPQNYAPSIKPGDIAQLTVPEHPGQTFKARVEASAGAVSAESGTTLIQLAVDNADGKLMPGGYASVRLDRPASATALRVPASALVFDDSGLRVATLIADDKVLFKPVTILRDYGKTVELGSGLSAGDRVIESPPDGLANGDKVQIAKQPEVAKAQGRSNEKKA
ncbi:MULTISPECIES: efflux RND transporter periplasmic adaptor subunit [Dyella]|uniref:Efflux RND transporter periplasmic adaptor subunit n=2 Tax=Dyella TaxID=231454 RepID=A0A4V6N9V8_9GAMM|nr:MULTISPECIES: efflux RND transporter periplasmic adaptor subunit [Dyella]TBR36274.1 efflux RND transporter periplasmic adaptor subunit [Dyella terrae]TCI05930.1 efflux RND transporter periplasmic adaptor subunit [Dyella soli]